MKNKSVKMNWEYSFNVQKQYIFDIEVSVLFDCFFSSSEKNHNILSTAYTCTYIIVNILLCEYEMVLNGGFLFDF